MSELRGKMAGVLSLFVCVFMGGTLHSWAGAGGQGRAEGNSCMSQCMGFSAPAYDAGHELTEACQVQCNAGTGAGSCLSSADGCCVPYSGDADCSGIITEFPISTGGGPAGIVKGPDGALWFADDSGDKIGRITTAGTITEFTIPLLDANPISIAAGPDGALWFTENTRNMIGRITTDGSSITQYALSGNMTGGPDDITAGPDGGLWFTQPDGIARITTDGMITVFAAFGRGITTGPDGALWFTEPFLRRIGRITTDGSRVTEYPLPDTGDPTYIATGPDGALWFTEFYSNKIGRITIDGAITEYSVPTPESAPDRIAAGPDGAIWFTEFYGSKIGRITADGGITEYLVSTPDSGPEGIALGPDGALWFSELYAGKIGRIAP